MSTHATPVATDPSAAPAILLIGPTASGKTGTAMALVDALPVEIVSVDSAQVFRDMNVGTAKPDAETLARYPHQLVDIVSPEASYSAGQFLKDAQAAMRDIRARGNIPLLVGGTMLYVKALTEGLADLPPADAGVRAEIDAEAALRGWPAMHAELADIDPIAAAGMAPSNPQRIQRALEVYRSSGKPISSFWAAGRHNAASNRFLSLALIPADRSVLHQRIATRFEAMLSGGLVEEVEALRLRYELNGDLPSMRCVGYRQVWDMLEGTLPPDELCERGIFATRQLAKRQLTWLRAMTGLHNLDCLSSSLEREALDTAHRFLDNTQT